ncbi:MAG: thioredoxin family protein [Bacteroidota bacterium]|nr:thioredoxin family protein [Bacteroidota bacterium]
MATLLTELGLYSYESYLRAFEQWVQNKQSSTINGSHALAEYTKLNWARTQRRHKTISLSPELVKAVQRIQHHYTWLVLTETWCGDSAQNLPVIAEIAKLNPDNIKLFILLRDENPELMNSYLTNGAKAIPKMIAIDETLGREAFIWGPRPVPAQDLLLNWKKNPEGKTWDDFEKELHSWYAKDKTETLQSEFIELMSKLD